MHVGNVGWHSGRKGRPCFVKCFVGDAPVQIGHPWRWEVGTLQRNAGTAGIVAAVLLAVGVILFFSSGLADPQTAADPAKALAKIAESPSRRALTSIVFAVSLAFAAVFLAGLYSRLREKAPTRAAAMLYFGLFGLAGFLFISMVQWLGGNHLASYVAKDQVAASHAYVALYAITQGANGLGNAFIGASLAIAGWAIIGTGALPATIGWVGVVGGVLTVIAVFAPTSNVVFLASTVLSVVYLYWAGSQLRRA